MSEKEEYTLVIVKPDGTKKGLSKDILDYFLGNQLKLVQTSTKKLTRTIVGDIFTSKHNGAFYKSYMTSNESVAYLLKGDKSFDKCRVLKNQLRKDYGVDDMIENICHTPESGNEYMEQMRFFFPNLPNAKYNLYCDMYCKVYIAEEYEEYKDKLCSCEISTNSKLIYIYRNEEFSRYRENVVRYFREHKVDGWIFGIESNVALGKDKLKIIGYYSTDDIQSIQVDSTYCYHDIKGLINTIKQNKGVPIVGYSKKTDNIVQYIEILKAFGLMGGLVYHPLYNIKETEILRDCLEDNHILIVGGSGGMSPGSYSISYNILNKFYKQIFNQADHSKEGHND